MNHTPTIYEVYNTHNNDGHIGTYPVLAERLQRAAGKTITRHPHQTKAAHLHQCTQAAYPPSPQHHDQGYSEG